MNEEILKIEEKEYIYSLLEHRRAKIQRDLQKYSNSAQLRSKNLFKLNEIHKENIIILNIKKALNKNEKRKRASI